MRTIKTLRKYVGTFRVIALYAYNIRNKKYFFPSINDGVGEDDCCIPLKLTPKKNDWFAMSNVSISDDKLYVFIPSARVGAAVLKELSGIYDGASFELSDSEYVIKIPTNALDNKEVVSILKPYTVGKSMSPKDSRNLPKRLGF